MILQVRTYCIVLITVLTGLLLSSSIQAQSTTVDHKEDNPSDRDVQKAHAIKGSVWFDSDHNHRLNRSADSPLKGWTILLINEDEIPIKHTQTDARGRYSFQSPPEGAYFIVVDAPKGYKPSFDTDGVQTEDIVRIDRTNTDFEYTANFTYTGTASVHTSIWHDVNFNQTRDDNEIGLSKVQLEISQTDGPYAKTSFSGKEGYCSFDNLPPGHYTIRAHPPKEFNPLSVEDTLIPLTTKSLVVAPGASDQSVDFGVVKERIQRPQKVDWVSFSAKKTEQGGVELNWSSSEETYCKNFEIQRSTDRQDWRTIGRIEAEGRAEQRTKYSYIDQDPPCSSVYYRVHQIDHQGSRGFSESKSVSIDCQSAIHSFPNPADSEITVVIPDKLSPEQLTVFTADGTIQYRKTLSEPSEGSYQIQIDVADWIGGLYYLTLQNHNDQIIEQRTLNVN